MTVGRRWLIVGAVALAMVGVVTWRLTSGGNRVRDALAAVFEDPSQTCASVTNATWPPARFYKVPVGFAQMAVERAAILCLEAGPSTYYFRFSDHAALERAIRAYPSMTKLRLCVLDHEVFTGNAMDFEDDGSHPFERTCARLKGRVLPDLQPAAWSRSPKPPLAT